MLQKLRVVPDNARVEIFNFLTDDWKKIPQNYNRGK
jgi:hypothetical protein